MKHNTHVMLSYDKKEEQRTPKSYGSSILKDSLATPSAYVKYDHISAGSWPSNGEKRTASVCTLPLRNKTFTRSTIRESSLRHATNCGSKHFICPYFVTYFHLANTDGCV